jgi:alkylation response protein AidB-like acyl-CoA dehydrogenase
MDLAFTPEEQAFREKIRAWVRDNLPKDISEKVRNSIHLTRDDLQRWAKILGKQGWHGWGWPQEFGGPGWNAIQKHLFEEETAAGAPRVVPFGPVMVAPVIMASAGAAAILRHRQRRGLVEPGYASPARADPASLKTKAERRGDLHRQRPEDLTTLASTATGSSAWCHERRQAANRISFLLIDMKSPGITVRPIITMDGEHEVNEVWFANVEAPPTSSSARRTRAGPTPSTALAHERTNIADANCAKRELERVKRRQGRRRVRRRASATRSPARGRRGRARDDGVARALGGRGRKQSSTSPASEDPAARSSSATPS